MRMLEDMAGVGEQPCCLCIDANIDSSEVLEKAVRSGRWVDLGERFPDDQGRPYLTYSNDKRWDKVSREKGCTRPDRILVNRIANEMVTSFTVVRDARVPSHLPLKVTFDAKRLDQNSM